LPTSDYLGNADLGGLARCATQIRRWRRQNRNSILVDAGDVYQGTDVSLRTNGALVIDLFNHLKYDAWIVGNHEFDWGLDTFARALAKSEMPALAANMSIEGKPSGAITANPFAKVRPVHRERLRWNQDRDYRSDHAGNVVLASTRIHPRPRV
jgi:2',3'-cyclic-nucleotide 2'-phosphodiesterase (5'-nucleotidase family)